MLSICICWKWNRMRIILECRWILWIFNAIILCVNSGDEDYPPVAYYYDEVVV